MSPTAPARGDAYGYYPFWFWNGELDEDEIRWQIGEMAAQGIKGFYIHSRQGLAQPYLSDAFFRMVDVALDAAEAHGLVANLYDEYPYPSGVAGGEVVLGNPQFHATHLVQEAFDVPGGPLRRALPRGKVLACIAYPLVGGKVDWETGVDLRSAVGMVLADGSYNEMGLTPYNRKRYFASNPTPTLETDALTGPHRVFVAVQVVVDHHKYWGHYVDVLNPDAVERFIALTHERYRERIGGRFGGLVHAIFVDETAPGWSDRLPEAFQRRYGYDLLPLLPALRDPTHPRHLQVAYDLDRLIHDLFCASFEEPIARWCARHGLRYTGEKPSLRLSQLAYMDIPGCEPGHTKAGAPMDLLRGRIRQNARATASAAYFYGKEGSLCECFHSLGWSGTLQDARVISEGLLLTGIRYLVPHGFFYTTHALAKHDAPPTFFFQMPYWPLYGELSARVNRIAERFEGTHMDARLLVVDPTSGLPTRRDLEDYERVLNALMEQHLDYLIVDTDILESGTIRDLAGGEAAVHVRDVVASVVLLPHMPVVEPTLEAWLGRFEAAGGRVVRLPAGATAEAVAELLEGAVSPSLRITTLSGDARRLWTVSRTDGERRLWFLLNTGGERVEVELAADGPLAEVPLDGAPPLLERSPGGYRRSVAPFESLLLEAMPNPPDAAAVPTLRIPVRGPLRVTPLQRNLLRMGHWEMTLLDDGGAPSQTATVSPMPLPNQLAEAGLRFAPVIRTFFGSVPELELPALRVEYRHAFESRFDGRVELVMEPGSLVGDWHVIVNGDRRLGPDDFSPTDAHVRGSLAVDITPCVGAGINVITVSLTTDRVDGGLLSPLYLAGSFGVLLNPPTLVEPVRVGEYQNWEQNRLPYYAGAVEYEATFDLERVPDAERVLVELDHGIPFEDAAVASINGGPWLAMPWSPYRAVLETAHLRPGRNALTLRVHTTLIRSFEGQWFDLVRHRYRDVGTGEEIPDVDRRPR